MFNLGNITQASDYIITQLGTGINKNTLKATQFSGDIEQTSDYIISQSGTGTNKNTLKATQFSGNIEQASDYIISQLGTGINKNTLKATDFGGDIIQSNGSNILKDTKFDGNVTQSSGSNTLKATAFNGNVSQLSGSNTLNATTFNGTITQNGDNEIIDQSGSGTNILKGTEFNAKCSYVSGVGNFSDNDIPNKSYVDSVSSGLRPTSSCKYATTEDIPLTSISIPFEVDGYDVQNGDRVLVKSQGGTNNENTNNVYNGIYVYNVNSANLTRATDCDLGDNITNQILLVENGNLNGSNAFVQINSISDFIPDTDQVQYIKFSPMKLDFQLGDGLEAITTSTPKILQVKSNLDFLTNVKINGPLNMTGNLSIDGVLDINNSGGMNNPLIKMKVSNSDRLKYFTNLTGGNFNGIIQAGDSAMIIYDNPLSIAYNNTSITSGIRIGSDNIKLHSNTTNYYNLNSTGHNVNGNCYFNNIVTFNSSILANTTTITNAQLSYLSGTTSSIQTQLDNKASLSSLNEKASLSQNNTFTGTNIFNNTVTFNSSILANTTIITNAQLSYLSGTTSSIQSQLNLKATLNGSNAFSGNNTFSGTNTFTGSINLNGNNYLNGDIIANGATITPTDLSCLDGLTNNIQYQLNLKATLNETNTFTGNNTFSGTDTFTGSINLNGTNNFSGTNTFNSNVTFNKNITVTGNSDLKIGPDPLNMYANLSGICQSGNVGDTTGWKSFNSTNWLYASRVTSIYDGDNTGPFGQGNWSNLINVRHRGGLPADGQSYGCQIVTGMTSNTNRMAFRGQYSNGWESWKEVAVLSNNNTFSGNNTFTGNINFTGKTSATYTTANTLGYIQSGNDVNYKFNILDNSTLITASLLSNASYLMTGIIRLDYKQDKGDSITLVNVRLELYTAINTSFFTKISLGDQLLFFKNKDYYFPFFYVVSGKTTIYYSLKQDSGSDIGIWNWIGVSNISFVRLT